MKVKDLIEELEGLPEDAEVHFSYNYGDYWRTAVAPEVSTVDTGFVKWSEYHGMPKLVLTEDADQDTFANDMVVVLS